MERSTKVVRSRLAAAKNGEGFAQPPVFAAPFHLQGDPSASAYTYGRFHNPTWTALEDALSGLESSEGIDAKTLVFPSGMAAATSVLAVSLRPRLRCCVAGQWLLHARRLLERFFVPMGVEMRIITKDPDQQEAVLRGATLLWLETPTNPDSMFGTFAL